tara:strand:- start:672 stop:1511 length:840 start_codon:yes stop_codon:yes gene_type:complete
MTNDEKVLRDQIQRAIKLVFEKKTLAKELLLQEEVSLRQLIRPLILEETTAAAHILKEENKLRGLIRTLLLTEAESLDDDARQRRSTGINALADIMKKLVADLKVGYTSLTTSSEQRDSFRDHILAAIEDTLGTVMPYGIPEELADDALESALAEAQFGVKIDQELLGDDIKDPEEDAPEEKPEADSYPEIEGSERTGRNFSSETFRRIEPTIVKAYKNLADVSDRQDFYEYLLDNVTKYFERFETEMTANLDSPEYADNMSDIQQDTQDATGGTPPGV